MHQIFPCTNSQIFLFSAANKLRNLPFVTIKFTTNNNCSFGLFESTCFLLFLGWTLWIRILKNKYKQRRNLHIHEVLISLTLSILNTLVCTFNQDLIYIAGITLLIPEILKCGSISIFKLTYTDSVCWHRVPIIIILLLNIFAIVRCLKFPLCNIHFSIKEAINILKTRDSRIYNQWPSILSTCGTTSSTKCTESTEFMG